MEWSYNFQEIACHGRLKDAIIFQEIAYDADWKML